MNYPLISVFMPVFNSEKYLKESIDSIINQSFKDFELIIMNNNSTDKSEDIIKSFDDKRIVYIKNQSNINISESRKEGIKSSSGKYIAMLDSDDIAFPERLRKQYDFMENNPSVGLLGTGFQIIDNTGKKINRYWNPIADSDKIPSILLFNNYFGQSTIMIRKTCLPAENYRSEMPVCEDYDLWVRMSEICETYNLTEILVYYREHRNNVTKQKSLLMEQKSKEIYKYQLQKLGSTDDSEINFHYMINNKIVELKKDNLEKIKIWFDKLENANRTIKIYPENIFKTVIGETFDKICQKSIVYGMKAIIPYISSNIRKNNHSMKEQFIFVFICIIAEIKKIIKIFIFRKNNN